MYLDLSADRLHRKYRGIRKYPNHVLMCVNSGIKRCSGSNSKVCNYGPNLLIWCKLISYPGCKLHTSTCLLYFLLFWQGSLLRDAYVKMLLRSDKYKREILKSIQLICDVDVFELNAMKTGIKLTNLTWCNAKHH